MANNYSLILLLTATISGIIWIFDYVYLRPLRRQNVANYRKIIASENSNPAEIERLLKVPFLVDFSRPLFLIVFIILIVRSFIYEPFRIPSGSMKPTLIVGDLILVEKFSYGLRMPAFNQLLFDTGAPNYGDVVVFHYPLGPSEYYIKRIVGLPGDKISYESKQITIEHSCPPEQITIDTMHCTKTQKIEQIKLYDDYNDDGVIVDVYQERLVANWHQILRDPNNREQSANNQWFVPDGHYFVMGDNRDKSYDSRYWGFVSEDNLVGKATFVLFHLEYNNAWLEWLPTRISFSTHGAIH